MERETAVDSTRTHHSFRKLPDVLKLFALQSLIWTMLCAAAELLSRFVLQWGYPYVYPAMPFLEIFSDFRFMIPKFVAFHSRDFFLGEPPMYPAPVAVFYEFFFLFPLTHHPYVFLTLRFLFAALLFCAAMLFFFRKAIVRKGVSPSAANLFLLVTAGCSFALFFELHQANMEIVVWVLISLAMWFFWKGCGWKAAVLIGVAASMKIFPFVYMGLFLSRKEYRNVLLCLATAVITTLVALWIVCPDIAYSWRETNLAVARFRDLYMLTLRPHETGFDHSFFGLCKRLMPVLPPPVVLGKLLDIYLASAALGGTLLYFLWMRRLPLINQVLCLTVASILLPPVSFDYTLLHLYAPFAMLTMLVLDPPPMSEHRVHAGRMMLTFGLFAFLLSPQSELIFHGQRVGSQIKAVALVILFIIGLLDRLPSQLDERASDGWSQLDIRATDNVPQVNRVCSRLRPIVQIEAVDVQQEQHRSCSVLIAAASCMYNRYVDGLGTWQPRNAKTCNDMGKQMAGKGYSR